MGEHRGRNSGILWRNSDADASLSDEAFADLGDSNPSWLSSLLFEHGIEPLEIDQERKRNSPSNGHSAFEEESDMDALEESLVSGQPVIERSVNVTPSQNVHSPLSVSLKQEFLPPRPIPFPWKTPQTGHKNNSLVARLGLNISESGTSWTDSLATPNNDVSKSSLSRQTSNKSTEDTLETTKKTDLEECENLLQDLPENAFSQEYLIPESDAHKSIAKQGAEESSAKLKEVYANPHDYAELDCDAVGFLNSSWEADIPQNWNTQWEQEVIEGDCGSPLTADCPNHDQKINTETENYSIIHEGNEKILYDELQEKDLPHKEKGFGGFQTASGKNVTVSEEALVKARQSMDDLPHEVTGFGGFQTASGKDVTVSDEALVKARQSMDDLLHEEKGFGGFQTASGNSVTVSEEAPVIPKQRTEGLNNPSSSFPRSQTENSSPLMITNVCLDEDYPSDRCGSFAPLQCTLNVTGSPSEAAATESIDLDAFFEADFSQMEQHNTPHFKISQQVVKDRLKAQVRQTQRISAKRKRQDIQPRPGSLWRQRRSRKRISLKEEFCGERPRRQSRNQVLFLNF
ncbi:hypothetical protein CAPTEDRAFT_207208 [Capitella teleta]|uniref:Uncharacterized protein n=1 Tax=Capitella teleta TaxID=283909 RepID=R7T6W0_CAPTE|nr:hypothetical protein CAPTEDRAFT_207208 [Capitella teleta]|eukprot:ELT89334.1 hypothetical protein CAPTEDRAFT_207208 [Capitella teleta]